MSETRNAIANGDALVNELREQIPETLQVIALAMVTITCLVAVTCLVVVVKR
jgi:hypothetical protein